MKKTILTLENNLGNDSVIYRTENGYSVGQNGDSVTNTIAGNNYLNDRTKYKTTVSSFEEELLNNFAEYHAGYQFLITNIGLIIFYESSNLKKTIYL